jgi:hypothetical protein
MPEVDETDKEFNLLWQACDPMWKTGDRRDAKYFWLQGRQKELLERQQELDQLKKEVASARSK